MRIKKNINFGIISSSNNKFSELTLWTNNCMVDSKENYKFDPVVKRLNSVRLKAESVLCCWQKTVFNGVMAFTAHG